MRSIVKAIRLAVFTLALFTCYANSYAQAISEIKNSFNLYRQTALLEKVFVHTDKTVYTADEIIWFKVYCVDGNDHKPLNLSKVVYIDVLDNNQNPVTQIKVAMKNGFGDGSFYIPGSVANGNYKLRAYTSWMKNFTADFYFEKAITIINPSKSPEPVKETIAKYDVQFFPEGGNLVSGIESKVAFKVTAPDGKGVSVKGAIIDQRNDTLIKFQSLKFGMGSFLFTPDIKNTYKAIIYTANDAHPMIKAIPEINAHGFVMRLKKAENGQLDITVQSDDPTGGNIYLFAHTRQEIKATETALSSNGIAHFTINSGGLGDGISHLTVFNSLKQPVCERLYFKNPAQQLFVDAAVDKQLYGLRKKVDVNITSKDKTGKLQNAELSMAVYKVDSLQTADPTNIFSYLWLNADLKGSIESPDYYFKSKDAETAEALDNLMLTQGWRRFDWQQVLDNKPAGFTFLPEYNDHIISAKITNTLNDAPAKGITTYLTVPGKKVQMYNAQSDSLGRIIYNTRDFFGLNEIIVQTNSLVDSTYRIDVLSPFSEQFSKTPLPAFDFKSSTAGTLQEHSLGTQVLNIYSGNKLKQYYEEEADSAFYVKPYKTYKLDDYTRFTTMEEVFREYVSEVNIVNRKGRFHIIVLSGSGFLDGEPLVLLDGTPLFDINKIFAVDPLKIRKLEVIPFRYFYGEVQHQGIFNFTTYKGDLGGVDIDPKAVVLDYEGLQLRRKFYSPVYDSDAEAATRLPDLRNVLYWAPSVSNRGNDVVSFYTSDQPGKYVGSIQGIDANGGAASQYFWFEVK